MGERFPLIFYNGERIIRTIYSPFHFKTDKHKNLRRDQEGRLTLRPSFVSFTLNRLTGKSELSTIRFELEKLENCFAIGKAYQGSSAPHIVKDYFGFACSTVLQIRAVEGLSLCFTPNRESHPPIHFHTDIYDKSGVVGQAPTPEDLHRKDQILSLWAINEHKDLKSKSDMKPPKS